MPNKDSELIEKKVTTREVDPALEADAAGFGKVYAPGVDIYEVNETVILMADMPGVGEDSIDITLEKNLLTVGGKVETQFPDHELAYSEFMAGGYQRTFVLSDEVDRDRIEATIKNGVLRLVLPKMESAKTRKIAVKFEE